MKTILRIIVILLVAGVFASGVYALVENTSLVSSNERGMGQPPAMNADGQSTQPMERPEGGKEGGASIARGLSEVLITFVKLTGITIVVLSLQKVFEMFGNRKLKFAVRETEQS